MKGQDHEELNVVPDRPPSLDKLGNRLFIIPAPVKGFFRQLRNWAYAILIILFLVVPWTTFNGRQTIWLNIEKRQFIFFDQLFFAHDAPMVFFALAIAAFTIIFFTAVLGRVWCGWACPQTVFIDFIYRRVEDWVEGSYLKRRRAEKESMTLNLAARKLVKWMLFFLVSSHISHSFFAYFVGAHELVQITMESPANNWGLFLAVQVFTLILLGNFGWFREQFCLIVCPYGRFQSALMDEDSIAVLYDKKRGEPRKQKGLPPSEQGDCINCLRCVNVCPTGIDIRNGLQMECIACTACIDACDEVMEKVKKPKGLIRYSSEAQMSGQKRKLFKLRNGAYVFILVLLLGGGITSLALRENLEVEVVRALESPYQFTNAEKTKIVNHFRMHLTNQSGQNLNLNSFETDNRHIIVVAPQLKRTLMPGESAWVHLFLTFPAEQAENGVLLIDYNLGYEHGELKTKPGKLKLLAPLK